MNITVTNEFVNQRADLFVSNYLKTTEFNLVTRSFLHKCWEKLVFVNDKDVKPSYRLKNEDRVEIDIELLNKRIEEENNLFKIIGQKGELDIVYEDENILILNKKAGVVVHPGSGNTSDTLSNFVVGYLEERGEFDSRIKRGGIVHRLDKGVSGLILFSKNLESQQYYQKQFADHNVVKVYYAKVESNNFPTVLKDKIDLKYMEDGVEKILLDFEKNEFKVDERWEKIEGYIKRSNLNRMKMVFIPFALKSGGKYSCTNILPLSKNELLINIETGRMHQIRATLEYLGINIIGDTLYSTKKGKGGVPMTIELKSILLSILDKEGQRKTFNIYKHAQKKVKGKQKK